jgi:hypothetical protein
MKHGVGVAIGGLLLCGIGWGLHKEDLARVKREQYVADENEIADEGGYVDRLHFVARGLWSTELVAISFPSCDPVSADAMESSLINDRDEREIKDGLKRMGFESISCGSRRVKLQ